MSTIFKLWGWISQWLGITQTLEPVFAEDIPDVVESSKLYLVGGKESPWSAAMLCPCGCHSLIQLSLISDDDPCWRVIHNADRTVTLHPSIWRIKGCRSHFFVWNNRIVWARNVRMNVTRGAEYGH